VLVALLLDSCSVLIAVAQLLLVFTQTVVVELPIPLLSTTVVVVGMFHHHHQYRVVLLAYILLLDSRLLTVVVKKFVLF
jgi:hypothetical protein